MRIAKEAKRQSVNGKETIAANFQDINGSTDDLDDLLGPNGARIDSDSSSDDSDESGTSSSEDFSNDDDNPPDDNDDSNNENGKSKQKRKNNAKKKREMKKLKKIKKRYAKLAKKFVKVKLAKKKAEIRGIHKVFDTDSGTYVEKPTTQPLHPHRLVWEAIKGLKKNERVVRFLNREKWVVHSDIDKKNNPMPTKGIPHAPISFGAFWMVGYHRGLMKLVDAAPQTIEAKFVALYQANQAVEWVLQKIAQGKNESRIQDAAISALDDADLRGGKATEEHLKALKEYEDDHDLGKSDFNASRFDRKESKGYRNEQGCISNKKYDELAKDEFKRDMKRLRGDGSPHKPTLPTPFRRSYQPTRYPRGNDKPRFRSHRSSAKGKSVAPLLDRFFDPKWHVPKGSPGGTPFCENWQTDSCMKGHMVCTEFHRCKFCNIVHPGNQCFNK